MPRRFHALIVSVALLAATAARAHAAGVLVPRDGSPPIHVQSQRVTAVVDDGIARTTLRQTFVNPHNRTLEAVYVFPVPEGAALVDVAMEVGGQRLEGLLVERQQARRIYDSLVRRRVDPALVEQIGREQFRLSVFPVLPDEPTLVEITWTQHVPLERGEMRYVYPLALAGGAAAAEVDFSIAVTMRSSVPLVSTASATPGAEVVRRSANEALVSMEASAARLDADFVVTARVESAEPRLDVRTFRSAAGDGWFAAVVTPPAARPEEVLPRDVTLVVDTSGSMQGSKIEQARAAALHLLRGLRPTDRVNVATFSSSVVPFAPAPVPASDENLAKLRVFVEAIRARGGTALADAVTFAASVPAAEGRVATSVLLTDGQPTIGVSAPAAIVGRAKTSAVRIFTFGVGADAAGDLLRGVAAASRGSSEVFREGAEIEARLRRFLDRTATPVMTDVRLEVDGVVVHDVLPRPVPDAYAGEQLVLTGRFRDGGEATVAVHARVGSREIALTKRVAFPAKQGGTSAARDLHARQHLEFLQDSLRLRTGLADGAYFAALDRGAYSTADEIVAEIVATSLETGVQSPYTSFLVLLPEDRARLDPRDTAALDEALRRVRERVADLGPTPPSDDGPMPAGPMGGPDLGGASGGAEGGDLGGDASSGGDEGGGSDLGGGLGAGGGSDAGAGFGEGGASSGGGGAPAPGGGSFGIRGKSPVPSVVERGLRWLAMRQAADGHWAAEPSGRVGDVGATAQALLCFLGAWQTHHAGRRDLVHRSLEYLSSVQDSEGCFGPRATATWCDDNAWAALAMVETYALTRSPLHKRSAVLAVRFAQRPGGLDASALPDGLVGLAAMMFRSAERAGIPIDPAVRRALIARADAVPGDASPADVASGMLARVLLVPESRTSPAFSGRIDRALSAPPASGAAAPAPDAWYFPTLLAFRIGGDRWRAWASALVPAAEARVLPRGEPGSGGVSRLTSTTLGMLCAEIVLGYGRVAGTR